MAAAVGMALSQSAVSSCAGGVTAHCRQDSVVSSSSPVVKASMKSSNFVGCIQSLKSQRNAVSFSSGSRTYCVRAMAEEITGAAKKEPEFYEVELDKPYGLRFYKGADGGTYIDQVFPGSNADETKLFTAGDKVISTSAVFGTEIWPAAEYGRTMYTIRQRIGPLLMRVEKRYGIREDKPNAEEVAKERNAGQLGDAIREIQIKNYLRKQEMKEQREEQLGEGLKLYRAGKYQDALEKFETVLGLRPDYKEERVASYNVACCYAKLNQIDAGLSALEEALEAGFEDFKTVREDPDLANLRDSPKFIPMLNRYDEPFINENAMNAIKNVFNIFGKK